MTTYIYRRATFIYTYVLKNASLFSRVIFYLTNVDFLFSSVYICVYCELFVCLFKSCTVIRFDCFRTVVMAFCRFVLLVALFCFVRAIQHQYRRQSWCNNASYRQSRKQFRKSGKRESSNGVESDEKYCQDNWKIE